MWLKYDRDWFVCKQAASVPVIFEPPCRCYRILYCTYNLLNMFRVLICPSSGARDYTCVIAACGVQCLGCWWSAVRCRAAGYASGMRESVRQLSSNLPHPGRIACCTARNSRPPATKALHTVCSSNTNIVSSSWWWAYKCPKHVEQIISAIKHSVTSGWFSSLCLWMKDVYIHACTERNAHY